MSPHRTFNSNALILIAAVLALVADQVSKHFITASFLPGESRIVAPNVLKWTYERNIHGAFGLFGSNGILLVVMAVIVLFIFWISFREQAAHSRLVCIAFGLIVGGAIGNIFDRGHLGYVVDFIDFYRIWPNIFNVGDSCITSGVILLLLSSLGRPRRHA